jgi:hypothetical protein
MGSGGIFDLFRGTEMWCPLGKLAASPPQGGFGQSFFFLLFDLHADEAQHAGSASLAGIEGLLRFRLIEGLADRLREEHDEAA